MRRPALRLEVRALKRLALASIVVGGLAVFAGYGSASTSGQWVMTDVAAQARLEFPHYTGVALVGMTPSGRVVWTAQSTTGSQDDREVFQWQNGHIADLGALPRHSLPAGFNAGGAIIGSSEDPPYCPPYGPPPGCKSGPSHSYLWQPGKVTFLGSLGAAAINDRGQIVGAIESAHGKRHAVLWQDGKLTDLGTAGGTDSYAWAINNRGQVLLDISSKKSDETVLWQNGKTTPVVLPRNCNAETFNDRGQVIGECQKGVATRGFLWQNGKTTDLGATFGGSQMVINDRGDVIESKPTSNASNRAILWRDGKKIDLGSFGGPRTSPLALNERDQVVGVSTFPGLQDGFLDWHAFFWQNGKLTMLPSDGEAFVDVMDINEAGTFIAGGTKPYECDLNGCDGTLLVWQYR